MMADGPKPVVLVVLLQVLVASTRSLIIIQEDQLDRSPRNTHHHHHHGAGDDEDTEKDFFDRVAKFGLRIVDGGKDREGAEDLGNDLLFLSHNHQQQHHDDQEALAKMRKLFKSGVPVGELFKSHPLEIRSTTPRGLITVSTVRLPIKDHAHQLDTPTEMVLTDSVAEPVFKMTSAEAGGEEQTTIPTEYLTDTPYPTGDRSLTFLDPLKPSPNESNDDSGSIDTIEIHTDGLNDHLETIGELLEEHEPIIINDRGLQSTYYEYGDFNYYYDDYYTYDDEESISPVESITRTPRTPRSLDDNPRLTEIHQLRPRIGRKILSADPAHLQMSERDMEDMMMMLLHNAVTQVEMEDQLDGGRRGQAQQPPRPKKVRPQKKPARKPKVIEVELPRKDVQPTRPKQQPQQKRRPNNRGRPRRPQLTRQQKRLQDQRARQEGRREKEQLRKEADMDEERRLQEVKRLEEERLEKLIEEQGRQEQLEVERLEQEQRRQQVKLQRLQKQREQRRQKQLEDQRRQEQLEDERRQQQIANQKRQQQIEEQRREQQLEEQQRRQEVQESRLRQQQQQRQQIPTAPPRRQQPRPLRPLQPPLVTQRPVVVAQVKTPRPQNNQIPRKNKGINNNKVKKQSRRGKAFRENNSRNRIFKPPPEIPVTNFDCANYQYPGLYADQEANCEVFHMCQANGRVNSFMCPQGTRFDQRHMVCNWAKKVKCEEAGDFFINNKDIYS